MYVKNNKHVGHTNGFINNTVANKIKLFIFLKHGVLIEYFARRLLNVSSTLKKVSNFNHYKHKYST